MQSMDHAMDAVALHICERTEIPKELRFSKIDLNCACSKTPLDNSISKHCLLGAKVAGRYRFINGFFGLNFR